MIHLLNFRAQDVSLEGGSEVVPQQSRKVILEGRANRPNKFEERRRELAAAALEALAENGYANTSLRDIASKSGFSLGTLHYYFEDKVDLIAYCTRVYKLDFIEAFNTLIAEANTINALLEGFVQCSVRSVAEDSHTHRLWYDIKSQALFESEFNDSVKEVDLLLANMVNNLVTKAKALSNTNAQMSAQRAYWMLDGFFQYYLRAHLAGEAGALKKYEQDMRSFLQWLLGVKK
ncbi:TetR/AcrR family transcriptional regulator [Aurantivibrio infirmus]